MIEMASCSSRSFSAISFLVCFLFIFFIAFLFSFLFVIPFSAPKESVLGTIPPPTPSPSFAAASASVDSILYHFVSGLNLEKKVAQRLNKRQGKGFGRRTQFEIV
ncbi:hypothetical protein ACFX2I_020207 [Malus domestica]